jgi:hypothetical protein
LSSVVGLRSSFSRCILNSVQQLICLAWFRYRSSIDSRTEALNDFSETVQPRIGEKRRLAYGAKRIQAG